MEEHLAAVERKLELTKRFEEEVENGTRKLCKLEGCFEIVPLGTTQYHDDKKIYCCGDHKHKHRALFTHLHATMGRVIKGEEVSFSMTGQLKRCGLTPEGLNQHLSEKYISDYDKGLPYTTSPPGEDGLPIGLVHKDRMKGYNIEHIISKQDHERLYGPLHDENGFTPIGIVCNCLENLRLVVAWENRQKGMASGENWRTHPMTDEEIRVIIRQRLEDYDISSTLEIYAHLCLACEEKPVAPGRLKFCSDKCANLKRIERKRIARHGVAARICTYCNEKPVGYGKQKYCDEECARLAMLQQIRSRWPTWKVENMKKHNASTWTEWIKSRSLSSGKSMAEVGLVARV
tara:strand:- start:1954 stop:2991 length:1038 start_codon:yes stop_codon:yes gene_type:complete